jgi:predicted phage terminase large subunit-like protein
MSHFSKPSLPKSCPASSTPWSRRRRLNRAGRTAAMAMIHLTRRDPTLFAHLVLADRSRTPPTPTPIHAHLQTFLTAQRRALIELPRDHGKTTQICLRILWELGHNPNLRVKLVCSTDAIAAERSRFLREMIASNPQLREVFPHLRPGRPWTAQAFTVARRSCAIGPSVAALGINSAATGTRADLLICDDVVDVAAAYSRAIRERVKHTFFDNLLNLLEPDGRCWCLFTPWHTDDLNAHLKRNPAFAHFRRAIDTNLTPLWPEKWPHAALAARQTEIGTAAFARGYQLTPIADDETAIRPQWVRYWTDEAAAFDQVVVAVDPALTAKPQADASAVVVLGKVGTEVRCLEAIARRVTAPHLVDLIDDCDRRWKPDVILFESNAAFEGVRALLVRQTRFGPKVKGVTQSAAKAARVAAFAVVVENGCFRLRGDGQGDVDPSQKDLFVEMVVFPFLEHDDLLDAAAMGTAYLLTGVVEPRVWLL